MKPDLIIMNSGLLDTTLKTVVLELAGGGTGMIPNTHHLKKNLQNSVTKYLTNLLQEISFNRSARKK